MSVNVEVGSDGVAHVRLAGLPPRVGAAFCGSFIATLERLESDAQVAGLVLSAAQPGVFAEGESPEILLESYGETVEEARSRSARMSSALRRLETFGKPVACIIDGPALDAGLELALACHYRLATHNPAVVLGMPGVRLGLVPAAGATQRLPRLAGIPAALRLLLDGDVINAQRALELAILDRVALEGDPLLLATDWVRTTSRAQARWDVKGFRVPGGTGCLAPHAVDSFQAGTSRQARNTARNDPGPLAILAAVFEGTQLPMDRALKIESKYYASVVTQPVARNRIRTGVANRSAAQRLIDRPPGEPVKRVDRLGVIGGGLMGCGIARVAAAKGVDVALLDVTLELAERARAGIERRLQQESARGLLNNQAGAKVMERIRAGADYASLADCDLVIEAVFEQRPVKTAVLRACAQAASASATVATNTSTLTIGSLAGALTTPGNFIGLHFFSPVERMPLVEVIVAPQTTPQTLARALDFVAQLGKVPIVVNDSPGFYTSRVFGTYVDEGMAMLAEGIEPALIENGARLAGLPIGPLAVCDEVSIQLQLAVHQQAVADGLAPRFQRLTAMEVVDRMVNKLGRTGRRGAGGFYEYPAQGRKHLWPGLRTSFPTRAMQPDVEEIKRRLLHIQALESSRCLEEGVLRRAADGDLGSVLGIGFPAWTGGALSWIETCGIGRFTQECRDLARRVGTRFEPTETLIAASRAAPERRAG